MGQFARVIGNFERSGTFFGPFGLEVWSSCAVATATPANCPESSYGDDLAAGSEIGFALAAIPLWPLALKDVDEAKRKKCARDLLRSPTCCLDSSLSRRLRHLHPRESELLSSDVQTFLATVFARIAPTSTFIER